MSKVTLNPEQIEFFEENGYLTVPGVLQPDLLERAQVAAVRLADRCNEINYPFARADQRISDSFLEKIEHIFHPDLYEPDLLDAVIHSGLLSCAQALLGEDNLAIGFNRMHVTSKYSAWSAWHRDAETDMKGRAIKGSLPLFNECGFFVVPGSHKLGDVYLDDGTCNTEIVDHVKGEERVSVSPGDLLLFKTPILHRGTCAGRHRYRRAHLHFLLMPEADLEVVGQVPMDYLQRPEIMERANDEWRAVFSRHAAEPNYKITRRGEPSSLGQKLRQLLVRGFYYGSAMLPANSGLVTNPPRGLVPYVRVPKDAEPLFERH